MPIFQLKEKILFYRDRLQKNKKRVLFVLFERYYFAIDSLAFPLPQGFSSFFTYLGYRVFSTPRFIDYVRANVFQVNIDVMKAIMAGAKIKLKLYRVMLVSLVAKNNSENFP